MTKRNAVKLCKMGKTAVYFKTLFNEHKTK